jgi:hypothetical protein
VQQPPASRARCSLAALLIAARSAGFPLRHIENPPDMTDFPTARSMLPQDAWLCLSVRCHACLHRAPADLRAIIDAGRGDVPVKDLLTDFVVTSRGSLRVQPWRAE